ncbi:hypothetical protein EYF80_008937 [Liparis tanakae]|uniref:Uncharacterized protein n=1 Tax=Liparis tanakae TaxID=230148 RepID=A0A4Z2IUF3_9TELE|nr:hypothetical protein EYF80_008937 [Liparis tanakae]
MAATAPNWSKQVDMGRQSCWVGSTAGVEGPRFKAINGLGETPDRHIRMTPREKGKPTFGSSRRTTRVSGPPRALSGGEEEFSISL